jgi:hypothetical protein
MSGVIEIHVGHIFSIHEPLEDKDREKCRDTDRHYSCCEGDDIFYRL